MGKIRKFTESNRLTSGTLWVPEPDAALAQLWDQCPQCMDSVYGFSEA